MVAFHTEALNDCQKCFAAVTITKLNHYQNLYVHTYNAYIFCIIWKDIQILTAMSIKVGTYHYPFIVIQLKAACLWCTGTRTKVIIYNRKCKLLQLDRLPLCRHGCQSWMPFCRIYMYKLCYYLLHIVNNNKS